MPCAVDHTPIPTEDGQTCYQFPTISLNLIPYRGGVALYLRRSRAGDPKSDCRSPPINTETVNSNV